MAVVQNINLASLLDTLVSLLAAFVLGGVTGFALWCSAAAGAAAGADLMLEAALATVFVLTASTLLRPVVNTINRQPLDAESVEMSNPPYVIAGRCHYPVTGISYTSGIFSLSQPEQAK